MSSTRVITDKIFTDSTFPLRAQYFESVHGSLQTYHRHSFHELIVVYSGEGNHMIDGSVYGVQSGDVYLIKEAMTHGFFDTRSLELVNIYFIPDRLSYSVFDLREVSGYHALFELEPSLRKANGFKHHLQLDPGQLKQVRGIVSRILLEQSTRKPGHRFAVSALFQQLLIYLARSYSESAQKGARDLISMSRVLTYLDTEYHSPDISFDQLARMAFMSKSTFLRSFKNTTGRTPIDYLVHLRISKARDIMMNEKKRVQDLAEAVGFTDSNYFSRKFKEIMGGSPRQFYRKTEV